VATAPVACRWAMSCWMLSQPAWGEPVPWPPSRSVLLKLRWMFWYWACVTLSCITVRPFMVTARLKLTVPPWASMARSLLNWASTEKPPPPYAVTSKTRRWEPSRAISTRAWVARLPCCQKEAVPAAMAWVRAASTSI